MKCLLSTNDRGIGAVSHLNGIERGISRDEGVFYMLAHPTNHSFGHNTTYARAAAGTKQNFILEYVGLEDSRRVNDGMRTRVRLRHLDVGCCPYCDGQGKE